jgi:hypothetical protein
VGLTSIGWLDCNAVRGLPQEPVPETALDHNLGSYVPRVPDRDLPSSELRTEPNPLTDETKTEFDY